MVAIAVRCLACRAKKIKCDQDWPRCGQCRRGRRPCSGPPERVKFVSNETCHPSPLHKMRKRNDKVVEEKQFIWPSHGEEKEPAEIVLGTKSFDDTSSGDDFELARPMRTSPALQVASLLVRMETATHSPFHLGSFVNRIPAMLESSVALSATAACCVDAYVKTERFSHKIEALDAVLYGKALNAIHKALDDPHERTTVTTFLAVALMQRMETTFVASRELASIPCWSIHAGGISELLKYRGVVSSSDELVFDTMIENYGPIVSHSVFRDEDCFLATPAWQPIFTQRDRTTSVAHGLLCVVFSQLAFLPGLLKRIRLYQRGEDMFAETMDIAILLTTTLNWVDKRLVESILPTLDMTSPDPSFPGSPVDQMYMVKDPEVHRLISWHASLSIMVNNVFSTLSGPELSTVGRTELTSRNLLLSTRIWMLSDEARRSEQMRYYFSGSVTNTYESAVTGTTREWLIELLSDLHGFDRAVSPWTHEAVQRANNKLFGRC